MLLGADREGPSTTPVSENKSRRSVHELPCESPCVITHPQLEDFVLVFFKTHQTVSTLLIPTCFA